MSAGDRVLVTGASGFIGRGLCRELAARQFTVRGAVRTHGTPDIEGAVETAVIGELGPDTDWTEALEGVQFVVHLAGVAHRIGALAAKTDYHRVNVDGTDTLARAVARSSSVRRLVFISSIAVSGSLSVIPVSESSLLLPDSPYGRSKLLAEQAIRTRLGGGETDFCIVRPPLVYGPGNPGNMARLLHMVERNLPLPLGGLHNRRSFLYLGNLVDLMSQVIASPAASRETFVVADKEVVTTSGLLELIAQIRGRPLRLFRLPPGLLRGAARLGDALSAIIRRPVPVDTYSLDRLLGSLEVDCGHVTEVLGWRPPYSLREGLRLTLGAP